MNKVAKRVNCHCSNPQCNALTTAPNKGDNEFSNLGTAAHIKAASPGGPRYDENQTAEERKSIDNAIWLCRNCGKLIDSDEEFYTTEELRSWKKAAEQSVRENLAIPQPSIESPIPLKIWREYATSLIESVSRPAFTSFPEISIPSVTTHIHLVESPPLEGNSSLDTQAYNIDFKQFSLEEALLRTHSFFIIGPSGSGKTTALRWIAFTLAQQFLKDCGNLENLSNSKVFPECPVYVELKRYKNKGSLLDLITQSMCEMGLEVNIFKLRYLLKQSGLFLLIDGFDEADYKDGNLLNQLRDLQAMAPNARMTISSRYVPLTSKLTELFPLYYVAPLSNSDIVKMFHSYQLSLDETEKLFQSLEGQSLLNELKLPLIIGLVAFAYKRNNQAASTFSGTKGEMYETVVEHWFNTWESLHKKGRKDYGSRLKISCLARLGYEMLVKNNSTVGKDAAQGILEQEIHKTNTPSTNLYAEELLDYLNEMGILNRQDDGYSFAHLSFRDFFAALWMKSNLSSSNALQLLKRKFVRTKRNKPIYLFKIFKFSFDHNKYDSIFFLLGLLDSHKTKEFLTWHLHLARLSIAVSRFQPKAWATNQIFFLLRGLGCASDCKEIRDLKNQLIKLFYENDIYINHTFKPTLEVPFDYRYPYLPYAHFYALIGQLKTAESLEYLKNKVPDEIYQLAGLSQYQDLSLLITEFKESKMEDSIADEILGGLILKFPPELGLPQIQKLFEIGDLNLKRRLLDGIYVSCRYQINNYRELYKKNTEWFVFLVDLYLEDEDEQIRNKALSVIRGFGAYNGFLAVPAEQLLINALRHTNEAIRERATWSLLYSANKNLKKFIPEIINDEDINVCFTALEVLRHLSPGELAEPLIKALKKFELDNSISVITSMLDSLVQTSELSNKDYSHLEQLCTLIYGVSSAKNFFFRYLSVIAVAWHEFINLTDKTLILSPAALEDSEDMVRGVALRELFRISKDKKKWFYQGIKDVSPKVRKDTLLLFWSLKEEASSQTMIVLQDIATRDTNEAVRKQAESLIEYLKEVK